MNEIKQRLDKIIENQEQIILELAYIEAQNQSIIQQNKSTLDHLTNIETNNEISLQYSRISAAYSEATAWFALANIFQQKN